MLNKPVSKISPKGAERHLSQLLTQNWKFNMKPPHFPEVFAAMLKKFLYQLKVCGMYFILKSQC